MIEQSIDMQSKTILKGLTEFLEAMEGDLEKKVFELETNRRCFEIMNRLVRIRESLAQYNEKNRLLFYVGLIGHFSSGKSSTINSLLDLWDKKEKRRVGLNPTDKNITLIATPSNIDSITPLTSEGRMSVRSYPLKHEFLEDVVLVDTPGSGDPKVFEEIVQDFLPICDVIFYLFSAANPLDRADLPVLNLLAEKLPFVPVRLVVTRTDEFAVDPYSPISEENTDWEKLQSFAKEFLERVNIVYEESNSDQRFVDEDLMFIDNNAKYGINSMKESVLLSLESSDSDWRVKSHAARLSVYMRGAEESKSEFIKVLDEKLETWKGLVEKADEKIDEYQAAVSIVHNSMPQAWAAHSNKVNEVKTTQLNRLGESTDPEYVEGLWDQFQSSHWGEASIQAIDQDIKALATKIEREIDQAVLKYLSDIKRYLQNDQERASLGSADDISIGFPFENLQQAVNEVELEIYKSKSSNVFPMAMELVYEFKEMVEKRIRSSLGRVTNHYPFVKRRAIMVHRSGCVSQL
jgi:predicted GTPase